MSPIYGLGRNLEHFFIQTKLKTPRSVTSTPGEIALLIQGRKDKVIIS